MKKVIHLMLFVCAFVVAGCNKEGANAKESYFVVAGEDIKPIEQYTPAAEFVKKSARGARGGVSLKVSAAPITSVLTYISSQAGIVFMIPEVLKKDFLVEVSYEDDSLDAVMNACLGKSNYKWVKHGRVVIINKKG